MEDIDPATLKYIPFDLITTKVLPRLLVKTLVKFSVVCKSWYLLVRSPDFINGNLRSNLAKPLIPCFPCLRFIIHQLSDVNQCEILFISPEKPQPPLLHHGLVEDPSTFCSIGSCKGLLSFHLNDFHGRSRVIFLYNPFLRILKLIKTHDLVKWYDFRYGFGYNEQTSDHILVRITIKRNYVSQEVQHVEVYSLTEDSWHEIEQVPGDLLIDRDKPGFYLNGATHWLKYMNINQFLASVVSFDFNEEVFREVILPSELQVKKSCLRDISEFEGLLALLVKDETSHASYIWVMRDDGVTQSWHKRLEICIPEYYPRDIFRDGTVVLQKFVLDKERKQYCVVTVLYWPNKQQFKDLGRFNYSYRIDDFVESLLLLGSNNVRSYYTDLPIICYWK